MIDANTTKLFNAIADGDDESLASLLSSGVDPNSQRPDVGLNQWPLGFALERLSDNCVSLLIEAGADVNRSDDNGTTILHKAIGFCSSLDYDCRRVKSLIDAGADVNASTSIGVRPIHSASRMPNRALTMLIEAGADVNVADRYGDTPLHCTARDFDFESRTIECLAAAGANVNSANERGQTALHLASIRGDFDMTNTLLANGADPCVVDADGAAPVDLVRERGELRDVLQAHAEAQRLKERTTKILVPGGPPTLAAGDLSSGDHGKEGFARVQRVRARL